MPHQASPFFFKHSALQATACLAFLATGLSAKAGEIYKLRQPPIGSFGGEIAASTDNPGFFGTAILTEANIDHVYDGSGQEANLPALKVPLPTAAATRGAIPNGTYTLNVPATPFDFTQKTTAINLMGGYLTKDNYGGGRLAIAVNVPLVRTARTFTATTPNGSVSPTPPAAQAGVVNTIANRAGQQVQATTAQAAVAQNQTVEGIGDTELSLAWIRHYKKLKLAVGASLFVPTGMYDKKRGPNPGYGNFYTLRPGIAVTYALNPGKDTSGWDSGLTLAGRVSYGINSTNSDTDYRSGNFVYGEVGAVKVTGNWGLGANVLVIRQVTDDSGTGVPADGGRYHNNSFGPFLSYKLPGKDAGLNIHYSKNFGARNALSGEFLQIRLIKAW